MQSYQMFNNRNKTMDNTKRMATVTPLWVYTIRKKTLYYYWISRKNNLCFTPIGVYFEISAVDVTWVKLF